MQTPLLVIDPGHGGSALDGRSSPIGIVGPAGTREKDVTLALAKSLASRFGGEALLTREADRNLSLSARCAVARRTSAPIFLSLHTNAGELQRGSEVYVHERANAASHQLASAIGRAIDRFGSPQRGVVGTDQLAILSPSHHAPGTAACLIEADYLSSAEGESRLRDPRAIDALADAIAGGVRSYRVPRYGDAPTPHCGTPDRTLPYEFHFVISRRIRSWSFQTSGSTISMDITVRPTSGFSPQPSPGAWPPTVSISLRQCSSDNEVDSQSTVADGNPRTLTFHGPPDIYYFWWVLRSEWNVQGFGTIR
jgi:N-acetylmuramoyl-L-alanine amidase